MLFLNRKIVSFSLDQYFEFVRYPLNQLDRFFLRRIIFDETRLFYHSFGFSRNGFFSLGFYAAFMMIQDAEDDDCQQKMYAQIFNLDTWQFDKNCHKFFLIGLMYLKGYGVDQNQMIAIQYFDLSANFNFEPARWMLVCIKEYKNNIELFEFMNDWFNKSNDKLL